MSRILIVTAAVVASLGFAYAAKAADEYNTTNGLTLAGNPLGFHGVDSVALLDERRILSGSADHTAVHDGVEYYFATSEAKAAFEADPAAHMPQFGGFCALGIAVNKKLDGDPRFADIRNGKLYVFVNQAIYNKYREDPAGIIATAEKNWQAIASTPIADL